MAQTQQERTTEVQTQQAVVALADARQNKTSPQNLLLYAAGRRAQVGIDKDDPQATEKILQEVGKP